MIDVVGPAGLHEPLPINCMGWLTQAERPTRFRGVQHGLANRKVGNFAPRMPGKANGGLTETEHERFDMADRPSTLYATALASEPELRRNPLYNGPCKIWNEDEARVILLGLLNYFGLGGNVSGLPPLSETLPGMSSRYCASDEAWMLAHAGVEYLWNALEGKTRRQYNILVNIQQALTNSYVKGRKDREDEWIAAEAERDTIRAREAYLSQPADDRPVYFIGDRDGDIKIGVSAEPHKRLKTLSNNHPGELTILALTTGGRDVERAYHQQFADHRKRGEWFTRAPEILAEIDRLSA